MKKHNTDLYDMFNGHLQVTGPSCIDPCATHTVLDILGQESQQRRVPLGETTLLQVNHFLDNVPAHRDSDVACNVSMKTRMGRVGAKEGHAEWRLWAHLGIFDLWVDVNTDCLPSGQGQHCAGFESEGIHCSCCWPLTTCSCAQSSIRPRASFDIDLTTTKTTTTSIVHICTLCSFLQSSNDNVGKCQRSAS